MAPVVMLVIMGSASLFANALAPASAPIGRNFAGEFAGFQRMTATADSLADPKRTLALTHNDCRQLAAYFWNAGHTASEMYGADAPTTRNVVRAVYISSARGIVRCSKDAKLARSVYAEDLRKAKEALVIF